MRILLLVAASLCIATVKSTKEFKGYDTFIKKKNWFLQNFYIPIIGKYEYERIMLVILSLMP